MAKIANAAARRQAMSVQIAAEGAEVGAKYGPEIGWDKLLRLLQDRRVVKFPCDLCFDSVPLLPGEFAHAALKGVTPEDGYTIFVHPVYQGELHRVSYLVLHRLVLVNHGQGATAEDAETFGSLALGLSKEEYYNALCDLSAQISGDDLM